MTTTDALLVINANTLSLTLERNRLRAALITLLIYAADDVPKEVIAQAQAAIAD